jgi:hypothetical protein
MALIFLLFEDALSTAGRPGQAMAECGLIATIGKKRTVGRCH